VPLPSLYLKMNCYSGLTQDTQGAAENS